MKAADFAMRLHGLFILEPAKKVMKGEGTVKICICGKGGSGKSTVLTLLAHGFRQHGQEAIVLDSDESNSSLFWMLGFERPPQPLMDFFGGRKNIQKKMLTQFSRGENEPTMSIWEMASITSLSLPSGYMIEKDGLKLVSTGKIHQAMEGCACAMGRVTREFLKNFQLAENEIMLVDMEAGIEHFGRGVEASVDGVISVVEPSLESISLSKKVMDLTQSSGATFLGAFLNKISSQDQKDRVIKKMTELGVPVIGTIGFQEEIQSACFEGKPLDPEIAASEIKDFAGALLQHRKGKRA
jgi:CO dehydrogenase maturation factor